MKIPVFDLDWTLIAKAEPKVHHHAFLYAFKVLYNVNISDEGFKEGSIDNQIIVESLSENGIPREKAIENLPKIHEVMIDYFMEHRHETVFKAMPGVAEALEAISKKDIPMGLLTGNVEEIGWEKLRLAGIDQYFKFGAFGSMGLTRPDLVPIAATRASNKLNTIVTVNDLVVVGDTPLDVECAKIGGAYSIAVGSGPKYPVDKLQSTGANLIIGSMQETGKILEFLEA
ncbi:MAG: HAD family hydrolase [Candidatus Levyibacteriota bacterium]